MARAKILVCCCGSVAAVKIPSLCTMLARDEFEVKLVITKGGRHFFESRGGDDGTCPAKLYDPQAWKDFREAVEIGTVTELNDEDDWAKWSELGDPILHIDLVKWADGLVIAPLSANTLAKLSGGLCDNLVTCIFRAWNKPSDFVFLCPAMNTQMWDHPITKHHLDTIKKFNQYISVLNPIRKQLACGDTGVGALCDIDHIVSMVNDKIFFTEELKRHFPDLYY